MTFDTHVFVAAVAIGALTELITLKYPTKYRQIASATKVIAISVAIAVLPPIGAKLALTGLFVARLGDVFGELIHTALVRSAVWWELRKWDTDQAQMGESPETPITVSERTSTEHTTS